MIKPLSQVISEPILPNVSKMENAISMLEKTVEEPLPYGTFHWTAIAIIAVLCLTCLFLGRFFKRKHVNWALFVASSLLIALEVIKQLYVSYTPADDTWKYSWTAFPFQFCSTPMYVMTLAAFLRKGKLYDACTAFLCTYGLFAGGLVIFYPTTVFGEDLFLNVHTMFYHGLMLVVPALLYGSDTVKPQFNALAKALPIFAVLVFTAMIMNDVYFRYGDLSYNFNMFYISPHGTTPMEWLDPIVENKPAWLVAVGYIALFSIAAFIVLLFAMLVKLCLGKRLYEKTEQPQTPNAQNGKQELLTQNK